MDLKENRRAIIVGIFLALGVVIFIIGVFTLGGQQKSFAKAITVSAVFDDVSGLKKGNDIWFSGVKVGTVKDVKFTGISRVDVSMRIDEKIKGFIHTNASVKIGSDGLIGNRIVVIEGGSPEAPAISNGSVLTAEEALSTDDMLKTLQKNNVNLLAITADFKTLSHNILAGKGTLGTLLADTAMGMQLRATMRNLQATTATAAQLATQLDRFSNKLNTKGGLADELLTDTATFNRIKAAAAQFQQAAANANTLTENLTKASNKLNTTDNAIGILLNDKKAAAKVQTTLDNLQQSSIKLNEDLEAAQHNFLLKGYFKKKANAKADSLGKK
ncbi:MAG TPA: MlaD family protein [Mucilaginibacter sp.]|jgi:phospholipid/cholesterol/gamma-HCH transport system substrate-binding protein|nr:MlaD family protein [Mucilaginibacter sp.]